nr:2A2 protein [Crohivirus A]
PAQLVYKDRGLYKHYGVRIGESVFQMQSENFLEAIFKGEVEIARVMDDGNWKVESEYPMDYFVQQYMNSELGKKYKFSCLENCETWARTAFPTHEWTQSKALGFFGVMIVTASLAAIALRDTSATTLMSFFNQ